jgi:hypothetical protein
MTAGKAKRARRATVALSRAQVASILHDMGWEEEDVAVFWRYARREQRDPGCLARARQDYWRRIISRE